MYVKKPPRACDCSAVVLKNVLREGLRRRLLWRLRLDGPSAWRDLVVWNRWLGSDPPPLRRVRLTQPPAHSDTVSPS